MFSYLIKLKMNIRHFFDCLINFHNIQFIYRCITLIDLGNTLLLLNLDLKLQYFKL